MPSPVSEAAGARRGLAGCPRLRITLITLVILTAGHQVASAASQDTSSPAAAAYGSADPLFQEPYIDIEEWRDEPVRHLYVRGGFKGTDLRFSFYFPAKAGYQGRFFQHLSANTPQTDDSASRERGPRSRIGFAFASGGYLVESNMGGATRRSDQTITGFRGSAAAAEYSRVVAQRLFGGKRPYGYVYGGSGGAYRTIAGIEHTDVWDGAVPYVPGSPQPTGVIATGHERVGRLLSGKMPQILDSIDAGGSGDPYAGLDRDEREALREMLRFGVPLNIFWSPNADLAIGSSAGIPPDPDYVADFWSKPGYEGADPTSYAARVRVRYQTTIAELLTDEQARQAGLPQQVVQDGAFINPVGAAAVPRGEADSSAQGDAATAKVAALRLASVPGKDLRGAMLRVKTGAAAGAAIPVGRSAGAVVAPGEAVAMDPRIAFFSGAGAALEAAFRNLARLKPGDEVEVDNSASLAADVYNRHAVPPGDFLPWAQYLDAEGKPVHPQRVRPASGGAPPVTGTTPAGKFRPKVIMVASTWDELAAPWNADWYARRAREHWGPRFSDNFRLWYTDRAMHTDSDEAASSTRTVSYLGVLHQALRDVAAWVERGVPPPASTQYEFVEGQIALPPTAAARKGIQPVVNVRANGSARAEVPVGQPVRFSATVEVPPGTGKVVMAEWDFEGAGTYPVTGKLPQRPAGTVKVTATYTFSRPGTYFPTLRVESQRQGDRDTPFARIRNLGRVRVVVK